MVLIIFPYYLESSKTWVFDDEKVGLFQEPFVNGIPEMIDDLTSEISNAQQGFRLLFSKSPFPQHQRKLSRVREEYDGWWYRDEFENEGWLCPALFEYFDRAPEEIFAKAESIN